MKIIKPLLFAASLTSLVACSQQENTKEESLDAPIEYSEREEEVGEPGPEYDAAFAHTMAERCLLEIQLGELALAKAELKEVQELAEKVVNGHRTAQTELNTWADAKGIKLPSELSQKSQLIYDGMVDRKGNDFDETYSEYLVTDHRQEIRKLEWQAEKGRDPELKQWATEKIPTWKRHLELAQKAEENAEEKD